MNTAQATTFSPLPFRQLIPQVDAFVVGRVGGKSVEWAEAGGGRQIVTVTDLTVHEWIKRPKGFEARDQIRIRELGGEKDGVGLSIPGAAQFREGEIILLALSPVSLENAEFRVKGMSLGKYVLEPDSNGDVVQFFTPGENNSREQWSLKDLRAAVGGDSSKVAAGGIATKRSNSAEKSGIDQNNSIGAKDVTQTVETSAPTLLSPTVGGEARWAKGLFVLIAVVGTVAILRALFRKK